MGDIKALSELDFFSIVVGVFVILFALKTAISVIEWFCVKLGIETKWNRQKREEQKILNDTVKAVKEIQTIQKEIQETHTSDKKEVMKQNCDLRKSFEDFMNEIKDVISDMQDTMQTYSDNRVKDRNVSIEREKRLNDRIDAMYSLDACRDDAIKEISNDLKKLTDMFVDKQINDYRWEIINFAANISAKRPCTKDAYKHCFKTYSRYEKILEENGLENGEVEISMEIINESYKQKLKEGF